MVKKLFTSNLYHIICCVILLSLMSFVNTQNTNFSYRNKIKKPIIRLDTIRKIEKSPLKNGDTLVIKYRRIDSLFIHPTKVPEKILKRIKGPEEIETDKIIIPVNYPPTKFELSILNKKIYFYSTGYGLTLASESILYELSIFLRRYPKEKIIIQGHSCNIQEDSIENYNLSLKRAKSIQDFLIKKGVSRERLMLEGFGYTKPVGSENFEWGRMKNRRVNFKRIPPNYN